MAVNVTPLNSKLQMRFQVGLNDDGKPIISGKTFSGLKSDALNENVYNTAQNLAGLQVYEIAAIRRIDEVELTEVI